MAEQAEKTEALEETKNCTGCKKIMSPAKKYYRNGFYYCNKNCYKTKMADDAAKAKEEEESAAAEKSNDVKEEAKPAEAVAEAPGSRSWPCLRPLGNPTAAAGCDRPTRDTGGARCSAP